MDKSGVSKEAEDDALSDGMSGGYQTPTGRPMEDDAASMGCILVLRSGVVFEFFLECRTSLKG